ncbi:MAG: Gldg family protein, partial [Azospirillaceae bacterium]
ARPGGAGPPPPRGAGGAAPGAAPPRPPFAIRDRLAASFALSPVPLDATVIDPASDVLLLIHPRGLSPATLYAVDRYLTGGGRAVVLVDPYSEAEARRAPAQERFRPRHSDLGPFARAWGLDFDPDRVALDARAAAPVRVGGGAAGQRPVPYLAWLALSRPNLDRSDPITARLESLSLGSAGVLEPAARPDRTVTPLVVTSPDSARVDADRIAQGPDPRALIADFEPSGEPLLLAVRLRGPIASAFPEGPPEGAATPASGHRSASDGPAELVVVADTDLLDDRFWLSGRAPDGTLDAFSGNADFLVNAIEILAGGPDLADLRGRTVTRRPFERIEAMRAEADRRLRATEQRLLAELDAAEAELARLRDGAGPDAGDRDAALDRLRDRALDLRAELRAVRRDLDRDVAALERRLTVANIAGVPLLVALAGLAVAWRRRVPRRRAAGRGP